MQKEIKGRKKKKNNTKSYNTNEIKKRVNPKSKTDNNIRLAIMFAIIALLLTCYLIFGFTLTIIASIGIGIIVGIASILKKVNKQKKKKKLINILLIIILTFGILCMLAFGAFLVYIKIEAEPKYEANKLNTKEISRLYDINGNEYAKVGEENREKVSYDELPEVLVDAIVATEDSRFFQHNGFDAPRFLKASIGQVLHKSDAGGASTLSMQVVKNVFTDKTVDEGLAGIIRKFEDIYLSIFKLENDYTKEQIIEFYVNNHSLGGNIYGVEEASQTYFGKSVSELNLSEAAIIAGMFKAPNYYRPNVNPKNAAERRKTVLYLMRRHGYITEEEEELANSIPVESLTAEVATVEKYHKYQGYIDTVVAEAQEKYKANPYTTALLIYTNLDTSKQDAINGVMNGETYDWIDDVVQAGVSVIDSQTGKVLAIGNGRNRTGMLQKNYATDIQRQPGSTAKPLFDYGPGIEFNNWSTYTLFDDSPYTYSNGRAIHNWDGSYYGTMTLRRALSLSRNIPALKAFQQIDNKKIIEFVTSLGIEPEIENGRIHEAHAIGAWSPGTNPLQMSAAYAAFSNGGYYNEPYTINKIQFRATGEVIEHKSEKKRVMSEATAYMITNVLQDVVVNGGNPNNMAFKTGTTNFDQTVMESKNLPWDAIRDSWIIGYSTKTVIALWYGYDYISSEYCLHNVPATVQKDKIMRALINNGAVESNRESFTMPSSVVKAVIAPGSNPPKLAAPGQSGTVEYFKKGYEPTEVDTSNVKLSAPGNLKAVYNSTTRKVTITWNSVSPGSLANDSYGTFGYNVYLDSKLLGWTDKTSYTFNTSSPYGTYKVVATYKSYSGIQSNPATFKFEETKPTQTPSPSSTPSTSPSSSPSPSATTTPTASPSPTTDEEE